MIPYMAVTIPVPTPLDDLTDAVRVCGLHPQPELDVDHRSPVPLGNEGVLTTGCGNLGHYTTPTTQP